jgi:hypothetical protein
MTPELGRTDQGKSRLNPGNMWLCFASTQRLGGSQVIARFARNSTLNARDEVGGLGYAAPCNCGRLTVLEKKKSPSNSFNSWSITMGLAPKDAFSWRGSIDTGFGPLNNVQQRGGKIVEERRNVSVITPPSSSQASALSADP